VTLDGTSSSTITLNVDGAWTIYWGFEIMNTITTRFGSGLAARPSGVYVRNASNVKLVNLIIHDTGHGTYIEASSHSIEIYGWIVYNGGNDNSSRSDGHGIYVRNDGQTQKIIADNVIFNQFGFGIHSYAEGGDRLDLLKYEGNVLFIELPASVVLEITYTEPGLQGDRSTGGTKPATVETGAEVAVPLFLETGTKIKVDTRDGSYLGRVS